MLLLSFMVSIGSEIQDLAQGHTARKYDIFPKSGLFPCITLLCTLISG